MLMPLLSNAFGLLYGKNVLRTEFSNKSRNIFGGISKINTTRKIDLVTNVEDTLLLQDVRKKRLNNDFNLWGNVATRRILSIDGGGIRGIIPAMVVAHIEKQTDTPARDLFDLIVGTSSGGITALALALPGSGRRIRFSAPRMVRLFDNQGKNIFERSLWRKVRSVGGILEGSYSHEVLEGVLNKYFGASTLGECSVPTMVTGYDIRNRKTVFLKSWSPKYSAITCASAARATSAAPTFFEPAELTWDGSTRLLIDGAIFINSPAVSAYAEACELFPGDNIRLLSVGTGEVTDPVDANEAPSESNVRVVMTLLDSIFDGVAKAADKQMLSFLNDRYLRLQTRLNLASDDIDDASKNNIEALKVSAKAMIEEHNKSLEAFFVD